MPITNFENPIIRGMFPDPSICRVDHDFYMIHSSMEFFPGIPLFHSTDLVNWKLVSYVLNRRSQLNLDGIRSSYGIFAPTIRYSGGVFYVTSTLIGRGGGFVVTATDPLGEWSDPYWFEDESVLALPPNAVIPHVSEFIRYEGIPYLFREAPGIDHSLFFDEDGRAYVLGNQIPRGSSIRKREIWMREYSLEKKKLVGEKKVLWGGVTGNYTEGPHIYRRSGWYYLLAAEGGTYRDHSVIVARSRDVWGPYESSQRNPILTHRHLLQSESSFINVGHADLVDTPSGEWWAVLLGCRNPQLVPGAVQLGRETFLAPVTWEEDWPVISGSTGKIERSYPRPEIPSSIKESVSIKNVVSEETETDATYDSFDTDTLPLHWNFLRTPLEKFWNLNSRPGYLRLSLRSQGFEREGNPSFVARRQQHPAFSFETQVEFSPSVDGEEAGIAVYYGPRLFYKFVVAQENGTVLLIVESSANGITNRVSCKAETRDQMTLKMESTGEDFRFFTQEASGSWQLCHQIEDKARTRTEDAGFIGGFIGLFAGTSERSTSATADFLYAKYEGLNGQ